MQRFREEAKKSEEQVRSQMADRIEKQLATIEGLIQDKGTLQQRIEEQ